jgi:hypothetical protein
MDDICHFLLANLAIGQISAHLGPLIAAQIMPEY